MQSFPLKFNTVFNVNILGQDLRVDSYLKHGMNSILMILDVFISKHEMKVSHFVHPVFVSFIYNVFNFVYFLLGGFNEWVKNI